MTTTLFSFVSTPRAARASNGTNPNDGQWNESMNDARTTRASRIYRRRAFRHREATTRARMSTRAIARSARRAVSGRAMHSIEFDSIRWTARARASVV